MISSIFTYLINIVKAVVAFYIGLATSIISLKPANILAFIKDFWSSSNANKIAMGLAIAIPVAVFLVLKRRR